jgi:6-pyruvoyltetrahydropterin/6-carboxytetrahydropterin synthase
MTITRRFEFDAAHRLQGHAGKCRSVHGHRYIVEVEITGPTGNEGMILDFGEIKQILGDWISDQWDHAYIAEDGDPVAVALSSLGMRLLVMSTPPTAENMARRLAREAQELLQGIGIDVVSLKLYETPNCWAYVKP